MCQELEIEVDEKVVPRIAFGFAGGLGNTGSVCGAVAGAVMAIGLAREKGTSMKEAMRTLAVVAEFRRRFEAEMGAIGCRELIGGDLDSPEAIERFMSSDVPQKVCFPAVETAHRLAVDVLERDA